VRGGGRGQLVQVGDHRLALLAGPVQQRGAAADVPVEPLYPGGPHAGEERREHQLRGQLDNLAVPEQAAEERADVVQRARAAEVQHHHAGARRRGALLVGPLLVDALLIRQ
jgi:hypothetical protein